MSEDSSTDQEYIDHPLLDSLARRFSMILSQLAYDLADEALKKDFLEMLQSHGSDVIMRVRFIKKGSDKRKGKITGKNAFEGGEEITDLVCWTSVGPSVFQDLNPKE